MGGQTNVYNEERSGRPPVVSVDLVQSVHGKICERWHFTISELLCEFPLCTRWVPEMLMGVHKTPRMASTLTFFKSDSTKMAMNFSITL
jgi:hypothetical protein